MNNCRNIQNNFIALLEGRLVVDKQYMAEKHLATCCLCSQLFHEFSCTYGAFNGNEPTDPGIYFYTRVDQRLKNKRSALSGSYLRSPLVHLMAGCLICAAGIFAGIHIGRDISEVSADIPVVNTSDALGSYASEYYLNGSEEESIENLINND